MAYDLTDKGIKLYLHLVYSTTKIAAKKRLGMKNDEHAFHTECKVFSKPNDCQAYPWMIREKWIRVLKNRQGNDKLR